MVSKDLVTFSLDFQVFRFVFNADAIAVSFRVCNYSQYDAPTKYDDGKHDATTYDGSIWYANADALHASDDASANDATEAIVPGRRYGCSIYSHPTSNGSKANVPRVQVSEEPIYKKRDKFWATNQ